VLLQDYYYWTPVAACWLPASFLLAAAAAAAGAAASHAAAAADSLAKPCHVHMLPKLSPSRLQQKQHDTRNLDPGDA
jgi:hypothetical protein